MKLSADESFLLLMSFTLHDKPKHRFSLTLIALFNSEPVPHTHYKTTTIPNIREIQWREISGWGEGSRGIFWLMALTGCNSLRFRHLCYRYQCRDCHQYRWSSLRDSQFSNAFLIVSRPWNSVLFADDFVASVAETNLLQWLEDVICNRTFFTILCLTSR